MIPVTTRERILEVAGQVFAERGRHHATIREIVTQAGVNQAAVNYHFRDKENLYAEVLHHSVIKAFEEYPPDGGAGAGQGAAERLKAMVESTVRRHISRDRSGWHGRLMIREMEEPSPAFLAVIDQIVEKTMPLMLELVGLLNPQLEEQERWFCSHSILALCNSLPKCELFLSRTRPQWDMLAKEERVSLLTQHISRFCDAAIGGYLG